MQVLGVVMRGLGRALQFLSFRALSGISRPVEVFGLEVRDLTERQPNPLATERVRRSLELINAADTIRMELVRKNLRRVYFVTGGTVDYVRSLSACLLPLREVDTQSPNHLAMTLVYQAKRAQLLRSGGGKVPG